MKENKKYFTDNGMYSNNIEDIVKDDENILWSGEPKKSSYILASVFKLLPIVIFWLVCDGVFIYFLATMEDKVPWFVWIFFAIHLAPVWIWIANIIHTVLEVKNIRYALTDKRVIVRSGVIIDLKFLYYTDITNVRVRVGIIDRLLKVGDIYITAESQRAVLYDIKDPYRIANELQRIVQDIKNDTYYPNALRPETNPGYRTKYEAAEAGDSPVDDAPNTPPTE